METVTNFLIRKLFQVMKKNLTNIYLIGPMGAGKTMVGNQLAKLTKHTFYDSDKEIEKRTGVSIAWIFKIDEEAGFRHREMEIIEALCKLNNIVLATGGGVVLSKNNRQQLSETGIIVYLTASANSQLKRISPKGEVYRPLFIKNNSKKKLQQLNKIRRPFYQLIADFTYKTDNLSPLQLAIQILADVGEIFLVL